MFHSARKKRIASEYRPAAKVNRMSRTNSWSLNYSNSNRDDGGAKMLSRSGLRGRCDEFFSPAGGNKYPNKLIREGIHIWIGITDGKAKKRGAGSLIGQLSSPIWVRVTHAPLTLIPTSGRGGGREAVTVGVLSMYMYKKSWWLLI